MNGIGIRWTNESAWQSFPACIKQVKFSFQINIYKLQVSNQILIK